MRRATVYVADDHPVFREGMASAICHRADRELVGQACDGRAALDAIGALHPEVALLDVRMPVLDGIHALQAIVREGLTTAVVLLSAEPTSDVVYAAIAGGAVGFVTKDLERDEICDAVAAAARGETRMSIEVQSRLVSEVRLHAADAHLVLTRREREVLALIAEGLSAPQIAVNLTLSVATIKSHLQTLYQKLGVSDRAAAVAQAMRTGLLE
jgi:two-component system nitrate/nitrite response regulator NarL